MTASFGTSRRTALTFLEITARRVRPGPLVLLLCVTPTRSKPHRSHWRGSELLGLACVFRARFYHDHSELGLEGMKSGHRVPQQLENPCSTGMTLVRLLSRAIFGQWAKFSANQEPERFSGPRLTAANHHLMQPQLVHVRLV
ncbi:uncharacterized protein LOC144115531 isoform X3 [Amblyomma americanum]